MKHYDLITPEGTKDLLFEDCLIRKSVEDKICAIFKNSAYSEVVTPGIEFFDVFNLNSGYFAQESLYKLTDRKGRLLVLRPDSTMPIARIVATRLREAKFPLRLYYNQTLYAANHTMKGKSDEIMQMGIELIGSKSKRADLEVLSIALDVLSACDNEKFRLEIGDSGFFKELVNQLNVSEAVKEQIRTLVEAKNYPALNDILDEIGNNKVTKALKQLPRLFGGEEVFEKASKLFSDDKIDSILLNLKTIYSDLSRLGHNGKITVDLGIVNRADYYTGVIMKGYIQGCGDEILSGGRYDKLISEFGYDVPATGFAVNVDAISAMLKRNGMKAEIKTPDMIVFGKKGYEAEAIIYAEEQRIGGLIVETSVFDTLEETIAYARTKGISEIAEISKDKRGVING